MDMRFSDYNALKHGSSAMIHRRAQQLRKSMTLAELRIWHALKGNGLDGLPFRRQQPILGFIVDFYCHRLRLVIEIDGSIHDQTKDRDKLRDTILTNAGMTILRFQNEQIFTNLDKVIQQILKTALELKTHTP